MNSLKRRAVLLSLVGIIGFALFYIVPYISVAWYALFNTSDGITRLTGEYFIDILKNEFFISALLNTLIFTFISIPLLLIIAYLIVVLPYKRRKCQSGLKFLLIMLLPALIPSASFAALCDLLFDEIGLPIIVALFIIKNLGLVSLILRSGLISIPREITDTAEIDGAGCFDMQINILLPMMAPSLAFGALIGLLQSFRIFREIYLIFGEYPPQSLYMIPHWIFNKFNKMSYADLSAGTIVFTVNVIVILGIFLFSLYMSRKKRR